MVILGGEERGVDAGDGRSVGVGSGGGGGGAGRCERERERERATQRRIGSTRADAGIN
jgi:hypothetical protein